MPDVSVIGFHKSKKTTAVIVFLSQVLLFCWELLNHKVRAITLDESKDPPHSYIVSNG